jgi:hypothetical protein
MLSRNPDVADRIEKGWSYERQPFSSYAIAGRLRAQALFLRASLLH